MRRLFFVIFFAVLINFTNANPQGRVIKLKNETELAFNTGNLKQSKDLLYLLSSYYKTGSDSDNLCKTWVSISILDRLLGRAYHAKAALQIAKQYRTNSNSDYFNLGLAYDNKDFRSNEAYNYSMRLKERNDPFFEKLKYMLQLHICKNQKHGLVEYKIDELIKQLSQKKDTLWFGYRNMLYEKGLLLYNRMDYKKCVTYFHRAIQMSQKIRSFSYENLRAHRFIIYAYNNLGDYEKETFYFNHLIATFENNLEDKKLLSEFFGIKGGYYYTYQMYLEANVAFELSINYKRAINLDISNEIYFLIGSYFYMNDYRKVIEWSAVYKGIHDSYYKLMIAYSYLMIGKTDLARKYEKEINKTDLIGQNKDRPLILYWLSNFYTGIKDYKRAEQFLQLYLDQSIKLRTNRHFLVSQAYNSIAYFQWTIKGDIGKALLNYQRELGILLQEPYQADYFKRPDISKSINNNALATCLRNKGEAFLELAKIQKSKADKMKYLEACIDNFELAFQALNKYKFALLSEEQKLTYSNLTRHYYTYVIECCYQLFNISGNQAYAFKAFEYIEKSKASVLLSVMRSADARKLKMIPDSVINKEDNIMENTSKYVRLLVDENNKVSPEYALIDHYNNKLRELTLQQNTLQDEIKMKYPNYYTIKYGGEVTNVNEVQLRLKPNQVLVQYALSKTNIFIFFVSKDNYKIINEPIDSTFESNLKSYQKAVSQFSYDDVKDASVYAYADVAHQLFQNLIAPLGTSISDKELIIIPDDVLNTIPFEALLAHKVEKRKHISYKDLPYLIEKNSIIYNYSASLFVQTPVFSKDKGTDPKLLALAPIHSSVKLSDINSITRNSDEIVPIPGTIDEVKGIHKLFNGKILLGDDATESKLKSMCDKYQIIHIASHGFVNNQHPLFSKLVFNRDVRDTLNDGLLNTYEIYNMHISAPLVVLSACNTGSGKLYKGEGTISLARGFYAAGAKNIIMTLWAITDKTSNEFVQHFYTLLARNETVPTSLQQAKLEFIREADEIAAHPFFWAGYISIGDPEVCFHDVHNGKYHYVWVSGSVLLLLASIVIFKKCRQKKLQFFK